MTTLRILLAILFLFAPKLALAGRPCTTCAPVHVAKPVQNVQNNTYDTKQFVYHFYAPTVPLAVQGSTVYQSQGLDRALVLDQSRRLAESATVLTQTAISGHQQLTYEALSLDAAQHQQSADAQEFLQFMAAFTQYKAAMRAGNGNGQPLALQAPQTPLGQLVQAKCISCHSGAQAKAGLDLSNVEAFDLASFDNLMDRIDREPGDSKRMPLAPAEALTDAEKMIFARHHRALCKLEAGQ